ncbi:YlxR family protein [Microlunatus flavus]|uniref:Predicted RNA-binding protein YlxR, DUF448 family n=1 Tax=Microlunatus flavus TaxID=1036181 RepID=A0A1H9DK30_9ACTN|nr:YlxR family protein [Microlunatus flavus]SEQ13814.1 Predicted RNA-binding protein YlxR, DUF448 family [Microlunatus flavus]
MTEGPAGGAPAGGAPTGAGPVRTCVGCRRRDDQAALLRVVAGGTSVLVDARHRSPGRGAYLHPEPACVAAAVKRRAFARALRCPVDAAAAGSVVAAHLDAGIALGRRGGTG